MKLKLTFIFVLNKANMLKRFFFVLFAFKAPFLLPYHSSNLCFQRTIVMVDMHNWAVPNQISPVPHKTMYNTPLYGGPGEEDNQDRNRMWTRRNKEMSSIWAYK